MTHADQIGAGFSHLTGIVKDLADGLQGQIDDLDGGGGGSSFTYKIDYDRLRVSDEYVAVTVSAPADGTYNRTYARGTGAEPANWPVDTGQGTEALNGFYQQQAQPQPQGVRPCRFMTDADDICLYTYGLVNARFQVFVDGQPTSLEPYTFTATGAQFVTIKFNGGTKNRLVEIYTDAPMHTIYCRKPYKLWKPDPIITPKVLVMGDSHVQPAIYNDAGTAWHPWSVIGLYQGMRPLLGVDQILFNGYGGSGYIARGASNQHPNYVDRIDGTEAPTYASPAAFDPDILIAHGGGANDIYNGSTTAQVITAATSFFTKARAALPNAKLVFTEAFTFPGLSGMPTQAQAITIREGVQAACTAIGVYYVDVATTDPWLNGLGSVTAPNADGENHNIYTGADKVHYTPAGAAYIRNRMAAKLRKIGNDDGTLLNTLV